jgi:hypothetical protein
MHLTCTDAVFGTRTVSSALGILVLLAIISSSGSFLGIGIASSITEPYLRARALANVAVALAQAGEVSAASRMAAATCATGQWAAAVRPVLLLVPSAFTTLARTLEEHLWVPKTYATRRYP